VRYLIDTHLLVWWLNNDTRLPAKAKRIIADSDHDIAISIASVWEMSIKHALGRLDVPDAFIAAIPAMPFALLGITPNHAWYSAHLPPLHKDPFDRLLVAQSRLEGRILLTVDQTLPEYGQHIELV